VQTALAKISRAEGYPYFSEQTAMSDRAGDTPTSTNSLKRRGLLIGAGAAGAAVLAAKALPGAAPVAPVVAAAEATNAAVDASGGYQVTAHVLRYYETARS
jgi:hypothetical protein